jgi:hypothetical protein
VNDRSGSRGGRSQNPLDTGSRRAALPQPPLDTDPLAETIVRAPTTAATESAALAVVIDRDRLEAVDPFPVVFSNPSVGATCIPSGQTVENGRGGDRTSGSRRPRAIDIHDLPATRR